MIFNLPQIWLAQPKHLQKVRKFRPLKPSIRTERWYRGELLGFVKTMRKEVESVIEASSDHAFLFADSEDNPIRQELMQIIQRLIEHKIEQSAERIANGFVQRGNQQNEQEQTTLFKQAIGIDLNAMLKASPKVAQKVEIATKANVELIKSIRSQYLDKVQTAVTQALMRGALNKDLAVEIKKIGNVTENRAKFIARDQTSKLNATLTRARHEDVGVFKYRWSTAGDERVRDTHVANDGKIFAYAEPPETGNPGDDYNCRCVAIPIFDDNVKTAKEEEAEALKAEQKAVPQAVVEPKREESKPISTTEPKTIETEAEIKAKAMEAYYAKMKPKDLLERLSDKSNFEDINKHINRITAKWKAAGLTKAEASYISSYTHPSFYRTLNKGLREKTATVEQLEFTKRLNQTLDKLPTYDGFSYRHIYVSDEQLQLIKEKYKQETIIKELPFTSSSQMAETVGFTGNVKFIIESLTGRDIEAISMNPQEKEVLFKTNTRFEVKDTYYDPDGKFVIEIEELL